MRKLAKFLGFNRETFVNITEHVGWKAVQLDQST